jgi:hypothetical protein
MFYDGSISIKAVLPYFVTRFGKPQNAIAKKKKKKKKKKTVALRLRHQTTKSVLQFCTQI